MESAESLVEPPELGTEPLALVLPRRRRITILLQFLTVMVVAELLLVFSTLTGDAIFAFGGLVIDLALVFVLPLVAAYTVPKDRTMASFLGALVLAPLLRVVSLATPLAPFSTIQWLAIVSVALLLSTAAVMHAQRLRPRDVFLGLGDRRFIPFNVALAVFGFLLGSLEFQILHPEPWIGDPPTEPFAVAVVVVFLATGLAEELIFRGVLLRTGTRLLGRRVGLVYVTLVFAVLHIGFLSAAELLFVVFLGLLFGIVVLVTGSLWGVAAAHTTANVALYLLLPLGAL